MPTTLPPPPAAPLTAAEYRLRVARAYRDGLRKYRGREISLETAVSHVVHAQRTWPALRAEGGAA